MAKLKKYQMKFTTGHDKDMRYINIDAVDLKCAERQLFQMYCSVNTTLYGAKDITDGL